MMLTRQTYTIEYHKARLDFDCSTLCHPIVAFPILLSLQSYVGLGQYCILSWLTIHRNLLILKQTQIPDSVAK